MSFFKGLAIVLVTASVFVSPAIAVEPDEILSDPALEERARIISQDLRCLVCQNQSIDDSNADLAKDLRVLVRDRLSKGDSDEEVIAYVVSRYGDFVLLRPPVKASTALLWGGPALLFVLGLAGIVIWFRRRQRNDAVTALTREEESRLAAIMGERQK